MPDKLSSILREYIARDRRDLAIDRSRLEADLRAQAPDEGRAIHLLLVAWDAGVPQRLRRLEERVDASDIEANAVDLVERFGVAKRFARVAVETWAEALRARMGNGPVAHRPDAEGGMPDIVDHPFANAEPESSASAKRPQGHADESPRGATRSAQDGSRTLATGASPVPRDGDLREGETRSRDEAVGAFRLDLELLGAGSAVGSTDEGSIPTDIAPISPADCFVTTPSSRPAAPLSGPTGAVPAQPRRSALRLALSGLAAALLVACGVGAFLFVQSDDAPSWLRETATAPAAPATATSVQTPEGYPVLGMADRPAVAAKAIEGRAGTLLATFGVRQGAETLTYQVAADFSRGGEAGIGLLRVFRNGGESATEPKRIARRPESDGYQGFTLSGTLAGPVAAPNLCVTVLTKANTNEGLLCAFAARSDGTCEAETRLGCANLQP